ncbi:nuclear protein localization protein 4 homolog isoform X2 [Galleria mellonella]|uniref:Nuclear protein localization protein 4 homolog isoform X2 n=1 Tax=Galleria mellonella TaxID=7137 RepID=A0ABM3MDV8_GALME|nr:nuclear protein localization protein 4 homolog isoform X2 [Galleria mellonella]
MSGSKKMTLRVQSAEGTARVEALDTDATATLFERVYDSLRLTTYGFTLHKDRQRKEEITSSKSRQLRDYSLQHGDMLYLSPVNGAVLFDQPSTSQDTIIKAFEEPSEAGPSTAPTPAAPRQVNIEEDEVDLLLYKCPGTIQRQRDEKLCRHNSKGCCVHCSPLEPWDEGYLKEHNIKHMSFHSYLRKTKSGQFISLDEMSCKIKPGCKEHPPWPRGICSKCQPGAVTLNRQPYRHVDNVLVEHPALVERFLAYWRATGLQRLGLLYGRYEPHPDVPLGVRARVAALYEPPQRCGRDHLALDADPHERLLQQLAAGLGLRCVGWIFTDLLPDDRAKGTVKHLRGVDTHFLSAQECIMAGHYQNLHPNACRHASSGYFGSKFVTVCITGDSKKQVHLEGYQVSGQCQALVRDGVLLPTRDAPDLGYIRDSSSRQYVPDVYYKEKDEYGNEVGVSAKRVPVAYLLVDVPCGVAGAGCVPTFSPAATFPPANRALHHHLQTLRALHQHICAADTFLEAMSDLHVLLYLATNETLPLSLEALQPLLEAVARRDAAAADAWRQQPHFATLEQLARAAADADHDHDSPPRRARRADSEPSAGGAGGGGGAEGAGGAGEVWTCPLCTFHNAARHDACEMCAMPRNAM